MIIEIPEFVGFAKIPRYSRECVITEKIDGTNGQIYIEQDDEPKKEAVARAIHGLKTYNLYAGSRSRWLSLEHDNFGFAAWAAEFSIELIVKLGPGRHFGEWWGQGINRGYGLKEKRFSLFNLKKWTDPTVRPACCHIVPELARGSFDTHLIEHTLTNLAIHGSAAAPGFMEPEGIVIYHVAGNLLFKKTLKNDDEPKSKTKEQN